MVLYDEQKQIFLSPVFPGVSDLFSSLSEPHFGYTAGRFDSISDNSSSVYGVKLVHASCRLC